MNNSTLTMTAPTAETMQSESNYLAWKRWEATFRPSQTDLLSEYVDPVEERHMELTPDDEISLAGKMHKRKVSELSNAPNDDFSFLDECFDIALVACQNEEICEPQASKLLDDDMDLSFLEECFDIPMMDCQEHMKRSVAGRAA
jgi:hypothetical protein